MTQDEYEVGSLENAEKFAIIRMAREAGIAHAAGIYMEHLERFAALVAAHEREKLAEQEPVAWYSVKGGFNTCGEGKPLYAAPVRTKDLTDDEINEVLWRGGPFETVLDATRAVILSINIDCNHLHFTP